MIQPKRGTKCPICGKKIRKNWVYYKGKFYCKKCVRRKFKNLVLVKKFVWSASPD